MHRLQVAFLALSFLPISQAAAQSAGDYKALICVFLYGGCDYANTVLATDPSSWSGYLAARNIPPDPVALDLPGAGTARAVLPLAHNNAAGLNSGREIGVHPQLAGFKTLFDAGHLTQPYHSINTDVHKRIRYLATEGL